MHTSDLGIFAIPVDTPHDNEGIAPLYASLVRLLAAIDKGGYLDQIVESNQSTEHCEYMNHGNAVVRMNASEHGECGECTTEQPWSARMSTCTMESHGLCTNEHETPRYLR